MAKDEWREVRQQCRKSSSQVVSRPRLAAAAAELSTVPVGGDEEPQREAAVVADVQDGVITFTTPTAKAYPRATVTKTGPARFGTARPAWIRARLRNDTDPPARKVNGVNLNTAWASNVQTRRGEVLGTSDGNPGQSMSCTYTPVLAGERIEVLELSGPRAAVDYADLLNTTVVAAIGPVTAAAAAALGIKTPVIASSFTVDGLVEALVDHFRAADAAAAT